MARVKCPKCFFVNADGDSVCAKCQTPLPVIRIAPALSAAPAGPSAGEGAIQFQRGQIVANRYTVLQVVARGGMGLIYKVRDNTLGEEVALKTLLPQFLKDKLVVERFFNEARIARRLAHPNIARVHDIGQAGGLVYISMEFMQGQSLRGLIEKQPQGQRLPLQLTLRIFDELCAALEYAHQFTVHRDIKPENVMICDDGSVKLMDFGISKLMANTQLTGASVVMGTPFYMSPEQLKNSRDVDARADLFSVGVMLYEVLTGNMPTGIPKPASQVRGELPAELDVVINRCVDPDPRNRYATAKELRGVLKPIYDRVRGGEELTPGRVGSGAKPMRPSRAAGRDGVRRALGALGAAAVLLGTGFALSALGRPAAATSDGRFERVAALIAQVRDRSLERAGRSEYLIGIHQQGDALFDDARRAHAEGAPEAVDAASAALQCYLAPLMSNETQSMVFVPPGTVTVNNQTVDVGAFFIDEAEVSISQFADFCRRAPEGWRPEFTANPGDYGGYPVTMVTYYDAQGYAAFHGRRLPTEAQWARAAYGGAESSSAYPWGDDFVGGAANVLGADGMAGAAAALKSHPDDLTWVKCYDMAGNAAEWTRTVAGPGAGTGENGEPFFGTPMTVCGGSFLRAPAPMRTATSQSFEYRAEDLGFRTVLEIPSDPTGVEALLARLP